MDVAPSVLLHALRLALGLVALTAALHKMVNGERTRRAARALIGLDGLCADVAWVAAFAVEVIGALLLLASAAPKAGALLLAVLWAVYGLALFRAHRRGEIKDCGCSFGPRSPAPIYALSRNFALCLAAVVAAPFEPTADTFAIVFAVPAALAFVVLYFAADEVGASPLLFARSRR
ncbi:hypothetical protein JQ617_23980 [Bradyrhizobium sp. KB893862 SZCCT0404]|uniref:MauE/DoxX family redox-associated membrane protein n=1 Tax=Bradyrhizobium sp. KB893862 SZCCT0404 TaxID=2807672 RepID=UPI001BA54285|nr:MauE/DoxX family redox-associated membrane protein [Bradyrhizobium sp. KB893862 SZCCT0404]MBR1177032.1 hypothetical protein [Bradyrhizobium sp. KB893862 SZCCT0404]